MPEGPAEASAPVLRMWPAQRSYGIEDLLTVALEAGCKQQLDPL
eukprot:CAMPEP_0180609268 /NCGR_PEP_ID=MMETSP1037_2-20121125/28669_1 /TAXON_ID=632150 /ORGANISM="Azadinium spinosum, Strain 3D9" /LENGTH=43 /DNA_ID= /DNA_START= /DNA_END= /DNA_ORIENTATION=